MKQLKKQYAFIYELIFYKTATGRGPVSEWLRELAKDDKKKIGGGLMKLQIKGESIGMPLIRPLHISALGIPIKEVRINLDNRIARLPYILDDGAIVVLSGFIKKVQKSPASELDLAIRRATDHLSRKKKDNGNKKK